MTPHDKRVFMTKILLNVVIAIIFSVCVVSCARPGSPSSNTVAVVGRVPVIGIPEKPVLESLEESELVEYAKLPESIRRKLQGNDKKLKMYALQLKVSIEEYNDYAAVRNQASNASVGVKGDK